MAIAQLTPPSAKQQEGYKKAKRILFMARNAGLHKKTFPEECEEVAARLDHQMKVTGTGLTGIPGCARNIVREAYQSGLDQSRLDLVKEGHARLANIYGL